MKVDLCLFSYRSAATSARMAIDMMVLHTKQQGIDVEVLTYGNALIHRSRNQAMAWVRPDAHALFVDDDMLPEVDALLRLLDANRPVVSALCTTRVEPVRIAAKAYNPETREFGHLDSVNLNRVVEGPFAVGTGFLLIDRPTIDALTEYYLSARDWVDENRELHSRLHVRTGAREAERMRKERIRRDRWGDNRFCRIFDFPVSDTEEQLGEDICLGRKLLHLNIPVCIAGNVLVGHLGEKAYSVLDMLGEIHEEQQQGAESYARV